MPLLCTLSEKENTWRLQQLWQYRLQFEYMMPAAMVFVAAGMKMGWCLYELPPVQYGYSTNTNVFAIAWLAGVILGVLMSCFFVGRVTKNIPHTAGGFLLVIGGALSILMPRTPIAIAFSCIFEGTAFGLLQLQALVTGGEVANKAIRGLLMSTERCFIWFGILLQLTFTYIWYTFEPTSGHTVHVDQVHGTVVTCLGITTIIWTFKLRIESPLLLLKQQRDVAAAIVLKQLQGRDSANNELKRLREDHLQLLSVDAGGSCWNIFRKHNMLALLIVLVLRVFVALSMSQPFNSIFLSASWLGFDCDMNCLYTLPIAGFLGSILGGLAIDRYGRRRLCAVTLLPSAICMFFAGGVLHYRAQGDASVNANDLELVATLVLIYQLMTCMGISIVATAYLAEAFTVIEKPKCIAVVLITENLIHILMIIPSGMIFNAVPLYLVIGVICLKLIFYTFLCMPETTNLTLYESLLKFEGLSISK